MAYQMAKGKGMINLDLIGDKELIQLIKGLDKKLSDKLLFATLKKGSNRIINAAKANVPAVYDKYKKAIKFKRTKRYRPQIMGYVGPERGKKAKVDFWFANFLEYGASGVISPKRKYYEDRKPEHRRRVDKQYAPYLAWVAKQPVGTQYKKPTAPRPFMRPAIESQGKNSQEEIMKDLRKVIMSYWKRGAKKAGWMVKV